MLHPEIATLTFSVIESYQIDRFVGHFDRCSWTKPSKLPTMDTKESCLVIWFVNIDQFMTLNGNYFSKKKRTVMNLDQSNLKNGTGERFNPTVFFFSTREEVSTPTVFAAHSNLI